MERVKKFSLLAGALIALCALLVMFSACGSHELEGSWNRDDGEYYTTGVPETLTFGCDFFGRCYLDYYGYKAYLSSERESTGGTEYYFSFSEKTGGGALLDPEVRGFSAKVVLSVDGETLTLAHFSSSKMGSGADVYCDEQMTYLRAGAAG